MEKCFNEMTTLKKGSLLDNIELCSKHGFSNIEIRKGNLIRYLRQGGTLEKLRDVLVERRVYAASVNALESITFLTKNSGRMLKEIADWSFSACRTINCDCMEVIASFEIEDKSEKEIVDETSQSLLRLSDLAEKYNMNLALEFMAVPGSSVKSFNQCLEIIRKTNRDNVGMLLDTWHFYAGGSNPAEILQMNSGEVFMLHVSDCPQYEPFTAPRSESYWPGEGAIPLEKIVRNLKSIGYGGMCSMEVMSPQIHELSPNDSIATAKEKIDSLLIKI